jgi:hypothetical protein
MRRFRRFINDPSYWRARANEMREVAAKATDPKVKAATFGAADAYDTLAQMGKSSLASELPDATPHPVLKKERALLSGLPSIRDFAALENLNGNDQPPQATTPMPATTGDGDHERLGLIYALEDQDQARRLPRATQLPPVRGLTPVDAPRAVPKRLSIDLYNRMQTPMIVRPERTLSGRTSILVAGALIAASAGCFLIAIWPPETDFTDNPVPSETRLSQLPQAGLAPIPLKGRTAESDSSEQELKLRMSSEDKPTESGQVVPATESMTKGDANATPASKSVVQASPSSSADPALEALDSEPPIERKRRPAASVDVSSCFPSASAVRQDHPEAWPRWTLQAPGHEGTKCWYAGTRATVHEH